MLWSTLQQKRQTSEKYKPSFYIIIHQNNTQLEHIDYTT
jgi:hypothetical protein